MFRYAEDVQDVLQEEVGAVRRDLELMADMSYVGRSS